MYVLYDAVILLVNSFFYILIKFSIIFLVKLYHITNKMSSIFQFSSDSKAHASRQAKFCLPWFFISAANSYFSRVYVFLL